MLTGCSRKRNRGTHSDALPESEKADPNCQSTKTGQQEREEERRGRTFPSLKLLLLLLLPLPLLSVKVGFGRRDDRLVAAEPISDVMKLGAQPQCKPRYGKVDGFRLEEVSCRMEIL